MKILVYFSGKLYEAKGTPIRTRNMVAQLLKNSADVYYAGYDKPKELTDSKFLLLTSKLKRIGGLISFVRKNNIDLVYIQTSAGIWYAPFITLFTKARCGVDFHSRRFQEEKMYKKKGTLWLFFFEQLELFFASFLVFGTAVSHTLTKYYGRRVKKLLTVPVGVDTILFSPNIAPRKDIMEWKGDSTLIAYAGNTKWYQGIDVLLEQFAKISKEHRGIFKFLVIASSGIEDVETFMKKEGLSSSVKVLDKQPHEEIPSLLASADILTVVRPSDMVTEFSFPSKLPEYAALGKVLIVSDVSDIGEYIHSGDNGIIIKAGDTGALYEALFQASDKTLQKNLGENARRLAVSVFDLNELGKKVYSFLSGIK